MSENQESGLKRFSIGIVLKDKEENSYLIYVDPIEETSGTNDDLGSKVETSTTELKDHRGVVKKSSLVGGAGIEAKWIALGVSNRMTPPDVYAGESVQIYRYADTNSYYWTTMTQEPGIRRLEKMVVGCSNLREKGAAYDLDTSYWVMLDTRNKKVKLHTADNDGEAMTFDIEIDTQEGLLSIQDGMGNQLLWDGVNGTLNGVMNEEINLKTKRIRFDASESYSVTTQTSTLKAENHTTKAENILNQAASITDDGKLSVTNGMAVASRDGGAVCSVAGGMDVEGDISSDGSIYAKGDILNGGSNSNHHSH